MFCARCGQQIPEVEICPLCGQETAIHLEPPPIAAVASAPAPMLDQGPIQQFTINPSGVQGWLLVYCILLTTLSPLLIMFQIFATMTVSAFRHMPDSFLLLDALRVFYGVVVGVFLWAKKPIALVLLRIYFAAVAVMLVLNTLRQIEFFMRIHSSQLYLSGRFTVIGMLMGYTVLWFVYFKKSVRVRNTYGANL